MGNSMQMSVLSRLEGAQLSRRPRNKCLSIVELPRQLLTKAEFADRLNVQRDKSRWETNTHTQNFLSFSCLEAPVMNAPPAKRKEMSGKWQLQIEAGEVSPALGLL